MASNHRVTDLDKNPVRISKDEAPTPLSVVGPLFPPCDFIFLEPCQGCGVSVFLVLFTPSFTTGWTSSGSLPFIGVLFYFPSLFLFVSSYVNIKKFCSFQFNRLAMSWPPWVKVWGWACYQFLPFTVFFSSLALLFLEIYRSFTMYE